MFIPPELEAATTAFNPCQLERRAACEVIAPYSSDPFYRQAINNDSPLALRRPTCDWDYEHLNQYRQRYLDLLVQANPDAFDLEAV
jgi:hypothetical protein